MLPRSLFKILHLAWISSLMHGADVQNTDVVLSCSFIEGNGDMSGSQFTRTPTTLVLKDLPMTSELTPEAITPFTPPKIPSADDLIFEVKASSVEIPEVDALFHADCNEQEVICELSRYNPRGAMSDSSPAYFIGLVQLEEGGVSYTLVLQVNDEYNNSLLKQTKLQLPLSDWGTLITHVVFMVFSRSPLVVTDLGGDVILDCGYKQQDVSMQTGIELEWRWQHRGHGWTVLHMRITENGSLASEVQTSREGVSTDTTLLINEGNASLNMKTIKVSDEGTYICTVTSGTFQTQQIIQLHIRQPPKVFVNQNEVIFEDETPQKLSCHCERYFPLDVMVEWFSQAPWKNGKVEESVSLTKRSSLSSHRQLSDGTFSLSSYLYIKPSEHPPGTIFTCRVSHLALQTPANVTIEVLKPQPAGQYYIIILVTLVLSILILYQASG